jgi:6-phosphogluconolactonase (cycloisomerase 2 family)
MLFASMDPGEYGLASFTVDADGVPTMRDKALTTEHSSEHALGVDPTQNFVYIGSLIHPEVQGYKVSQGMFTELKGVAEHLINPISSMTIDASGKYLFVSTTKSPLTHIRGNTIVSHSINPTTGFLTPINEQQDGYLTLRVTVTPDGKYLHAASFGTDAIYRYEINQGRLSKGVVVANAGMDILDFVLVNET